MVFVELLWPFLHVFGSSFDDVIHHLVLTAIASLTPLFS